MTAARAWILGLVGCIAAGGVAGWAKGAWRPPPQPEAALTAVEAASPAGSSMGQVLEQLISREYWASDSRGGLQAPNRRHDLRTYFEPDGIRVVGREDPDSAELLDLRLDAWGREDVLASAGRGEIAHEKERVEIHREGLVEWFANGPDGLEHGFTVEARPSGEGDLVLDLGTERARARLSGDAVRLETFAGRVLGYGKLAAWDARGTPLEARFEVPASDRVRIAVADAGAVYPISIDPLLTGAADTQLESDQADGLLGWSVSSAGDVNGDGYADVIVGAPFYDGGDAFEGAAFVFLGSAAGIADGDPASAHAQLESDQAGAQLGWSVSSAGDVNGDGYADVIAGAPFYDAGETEEGAAFVFLGSAAGIADGDPASAHAQLESDQAGAQLGWSVSSAGDVNGDGHADVIVGTTLYDAGETDEGAAFVFLGSAAGIADGDPASAHAQIESDQAGARLGGSVSSAGDVNGDGFTDVIVGAPFFDDGETDEGAAFVFLGSAAGIADGDPASAHAQLESDQAGARLGESVSSAGDVNGDGHADVIVGTTLYDDGETDEGAAFVFLGSAAGIAGGDPSSADAQLESDQASALLGGSVSSAGDVNGDGYADVIVGARSYDDGAAFVFLGSATGIADGSPADAFSRLESGQAGSELGGSVSSAGDVNGDGYADVIVGAPFHTAGELFEGAAFVFLGSAPAVGDGDPSSANAQLESDQANVSFGWSVSSAGDVNADGFADVIVGSRFYDAGETEEGAAFVFLGSATGIADGDPSSANAQLESHQANAEFGISVSSAGDVNGDGYGDVIVGAWGYDAGETNEGAAFVFLGSAAGIADGDPSSAHARLESDLAGGVLGGSVSSAGDVNGDGYADVIVGAPGYTVSEGVHGAAFLFLGSAAGIADGNPASAHARLESDQLGSQLGDSVSSAGDVNGDGYADVIVGASGYDAGESNEGAAFVFLGSAAGIADADPSSAHAQLESDQADAELGASVSSAGDVNGDGYADVIVGAHRYDGGEFREGAAFVFLGSAAGIADGDASSAHARFESDKPLSQLGASVSSAGDVNGDGYADVIVGAAGYDTGDQFEGAAFVFPGSAAGIANGNPTTAAALLESGQVDAFLGRSVSSAGDVNGDGYADVIAGAWSYTAGEANEGAAFVFLGNGEGRPVLARQRRGDGSGIAVQPWGSSHAGDAFAVEIAAHHPDGPGRVRAEVEVCPPAVPFGDASCTTQLSPAWVPVDGSTPDALLLHTLSGLTDGVLHRWRARVLHAPATGPTPANPAHGPWRRPDGQTAEADVRVLPEPGLLLGLAAGVALLAARTGRAGKRTR